MAGNLIRVQERRNHRSGKTTITPLDIITDTHREEPIMSPVAILIGTIVLIVPVVTISAAEKTASPYAGQQARSIKALSEDDVASLRNGDGMSMAKAAELNSYPGP